MRWFGLKVIVGALALTGGMFAPAVASAHDLPATVTLTVEDA